ncbi:sugar ABC transporter ATP-binding protein [Cryobacterium tepidiphilum]|uniref:Sugar ABC transporter ATP-binding protein n=2 Tax=Cryobacterium tepidiphilum TaxID=2486026 RepID=A0A3M8LRS7_9MICO|nr:sugar ABC transporter ATP-binding protein [Cryobacterium tepidiphilum]
MRSISKSFNGVTVLNDVDFEVRKGEVHALVGGNGAGKSTLMKILQGVYQSDRGTIMVDGNRVKIDSIPDAKAAGIGMVFQEFSLVPSLTVAQNIFLGAEPLNGAGFINDRESRQRARDVLSEMEVDLDPRSEVGRLGTAYWQLTEIAKALAQNARVLIMDEPTASLAKNETEALFALIGRLKSRGISIIYISHRMDEVYRVSDRITILRDGRRLLTESLADVAPEQIIEGIVGKKIEGELTYRTRSQAAFDDQPLLEVRRLNAGARVRDVSLTLRPGEIIGLAGLMGSGRTELARALFGIDRVESGDIYIRGEKVNISSPQRAMQAGIALIPEDRRDQGLVLDHSVRDNLLLGLLTGIGKGPLIDTRAGKELANLLISKFAVKVSNPAKPVNLLSGGNQQKVVLAKWLGRNPDILILDEPTAGIDIGTKSEILDLVRDLADQGKAVMIISSEYPELLAVSDRVLIIRDGSVIRDLSRNEIVDEEFLQLAVQGV